MYILLLLPSGTNHATCTLQELADRAADAELHYNRELEKAQAEVQRLKRQLAAQAQQARPAQAPCTAYTTDMPLLR